MQTLNMTRKPKRSPSFFKVLVGDFDNKMRIPPAFVKYVFKGNVPTMFTLTSDSGSSWRVRVRVLQGNYFFSGGWSKFVKYHRLEIGDFLVFFLLGTSTFDVLIYNRTACAKKIILAAKRRKGRPPVVNRQIEETPSKKCASVSKKAKRVSRARNVSQEIEFVTEVTSKHPSSIMVVKEYQKYDVVIPRRFAREAGLGKESITVIKGPRGGMWSVNTTVSARQVRLGGGWSQFVNENDIVVGDTLLFEHIPNTSNFINVRIVNKGRYGNCGRRNKQANTSEKNSSLSAKRPRGRPVVCRQIEETPSKKRAPSSKRTKGVSVGGARNITPEDEIASELILEQASFVVVLKEYQKYSVAVPNGFAKEMGLAEEPSVVIKDSEGRKWPLNTLVDARSIVRLGAGWFKFVQESKLEVGDTLLFQHIPNTGNVINFKIISKAGDGNRGKRNKRADVC